MKEKHREWLEEFLTNCQHTSKSEHTINNYRADLIKYIVWFEINFSKNLNTANGKTITEYKDFLTNGGELSLKNERRGFGAWISGLLSLFSSDDENDYEVERERIIQMPLAVTSRRRHLSTLRNFYEYLKQNYEDSSKLFQINPVKTKIHAIKLKDVDVNHTPMLTKTDWLKLQRKTYRIKERLLIDLLYWGAFRLTEITHIKVSDFDYLSGTVTFVRKGGYVHTLELQNSKRLFKDLHSYLNTREVESEYLFANSNGLCYSTKSIYNLILRILKRAGCSEGVSPHSFRKACATNLYVKTKDLLYVRDYLNHNDAKVTQTYIDKKALQIAGKVPNIA